MGGFELEYIFAASYESWSGRWVVSHVSVIAHVASLYLLYIAEGIVR
jgi:hypothetical protein